MQIHRIIRVILTVLAAAAATVLLALWLGSAWTPHPQAVSIVTLGAVLIYLLSQWRHRARDLRGDWTMTALAIAAFVLLAVVLAFGYDRLK